MVTTRLRPLSYCTARYDFGVMGVCDEGIPSLILQLSLPFQTSTTYSP